MNSTCRHCKVCGSEVVTVLYLHTLDPEACEFGPCRHKVFLTTQIKLAPHPDTGMLGIAVLGWNVPGQWEIMVTGT